MSHIHDTDTVRDMFDHGQVMGNEEICKAKLSLKFYEKIDNLCLNGYVKSGNRLVTDDKFRIYRKCSCDSNTLSLPTGKLMRKTGCMFLIQSDKTKQLIDSFFPFLFLRIETEILHSFFDDIPYRHTWIQRCVWILKNHLRTLLKPVKIVFL